MVPPLLLLPFALLLLLIATMPLTPAAIRHAWERYYPVVSVALAAVVAAYYLAAVPHGREALQHTCHEYFSFITLLASLFVVAGGIHLTVKGEATPLANVVFLLIAAVAANLIGTTGASVVLIRPWIRLNKIRASAYHVVFFIFVVSNIGGALTPIGDPPLFLGYLRGVPFFWVIGRAILPWLTTVGLVVLVFYWFDQRAFQRLPRRLQSEVDARSEHWRFEGRVNLLLLAAIVGAVLLPEWFGLREAVMIASAVISWLVTPKAVHAENRFTFGPIKEVAWLFVGIFITMQPALDLMTQHGPAFGVVHPLQYYFACGGLSSVLDNAPTYANFLQLAEATARSQAPEAFAAPMGSVAATHALLATRPLFVVAISLGSVFFGAMTYIGNGPNLMVKAIAHDLGVHCPTFFTYIVRYSVPLLLPILVAVGWLYLH